MPSARLHVLAILLLVPLAFLPVLSNDWVSWDDPEAIVDNEALRSPGLLGWSFTTDRMSHFQPLSWLVWAGVDRLFGSSPTAFHALSLLVHAVNAVLLYFVVAALVRSGLASLLGTLLYAVHPLAVEPVAWASAFPYLLSTTFLLLATRAYLAGRLAPSMLAYAASLLARPIAFTFPLVLLVLDVYPRRRDRSVRLLVEKLPFFALAALGLFLEGARRPFLDLGRFGVGARLSLAAEAIASQARRLLVPVGLTPLDPLPIEPVVEPLALALGALILAGSGALAWRFRERAPGAPAVWASFFLLALPSLGLAPSGLQATADRYAYVPATALAVGAGAALGRSRERWRWAAVAIVATLSLVTYRQALWWRDSVTLWGRAVELDASNDLALYFYAGALNEAGRVTEAIGAYRDVIELVPDHGPARIDLARTAATVADRLASSGELEDALDLYGLALEADPSHARALESRAMALFELGRYDEALPALRRASAAGASRPELAGALAMLENARGDAAAAAATLGAALERFPDDVALRHNLARLLAARPDVFPGRAGEAVRLAERVVSSTDRRDPRTLDTLALALHAAGSRDASLEVFEEAWRLARESGAEELAREIEAHARAVATR